ncbi:glucosamine--fructose-6-phosphate aminotransferase (isomerizing) [Serratia fonticola]|uniref:Glutamine--fructose-6-phosphate aminotransferase [isomerizing] n=1 Tax=Serratia fonticola TaxID=47917 RepID=A0A559TAD7_SERFO|nr:glucosamine--fructose-6-phosphate aminotransferase (isomerizing) [Serratia fonticola]TQI97075.1 glucosamine--fructose-6-phosphate aminotransferase (isomerizing) [Serratia fonticola]TVZ71571.1 glucosamine--fructose-6-phosphate aminotransferase (isomerizing) [Serratia fonticola]
MSQRRDIQVMMDELQQTSHVIKENLATFLDGLKSNNAIFESDVRKIYAVGCGDSLFAAMAVKEAFIKTSGIEFVAVEAMEFCRYEVENIPEGSVVFVISYSGSVARTAECATAARQHGAKVVALTGNPQGRLAKLADHVLLYKVESLGFAPGTISFTAALMSLYLIAIKFGQYPQRAPKINADEALKALNDIVQLTTDTILSLKDDAYRIAEKFKNQKLFYVIGAGPNLGIAHFGAAKLIEGGELDAIPQQLEEWAHLQYFTSTPEKVTLVICPEGRAISRARELISEMNFIDTRSILITSGKGKQLNAEDELCIPGNIDEIYTPLLTSVVLGLIAFYISYANGKSSYNFKSQEEEEEHYATLHDSEFYQWEH